MGFLWEVKSETKNRTKQNETKQELRSSAQSKQAKGERKPKKQSRPKKQILFSPQTKEPIHNKPDPKEEVTGNRKNQTNILIYHATLPAGKT